MDETNLTPRQHSVLDFIRSHQREEGMAPTVREICAHLGLKGPAGVHRILNILIERGYLLSNTGKKRSWRLAEETPEITLPVIGNISAGLPIEAIENREEELPLNPRLFGSANCFALRIRGDSMIEAHIMDGDLAIIEPGPTANDGEIVAALVDDIMPEATLKILRRTDKTIELLPANSAYEPLVFRGRDRERVTVIGRYLGIIRR